jgi:hypothetical protein
MGWAIDQDEANPDRMAVFSIDGLAGYTADGTTWQSYDNMGRNWDFGSVDWSDPDAKTALATQHEAGGNVYLTTDGKTWSLLNVKVVASGGVGYDVIAMVGVLDASTLIYCKGDGIHRSTDVGATWSQVSAVNVRSRTSVKYKGVVYLGGMGGLLVSSDNGATWEAQGRPIEIQQGPFFGGDDENTMVIVNPSGFYQTTDGAATWTKLPVSWPQGHSSLCVGLEEQQPVCEQNGSAGPHVETGSSNRGAEEFGCCSEGGHLDRSLNDPLRGSHERCGGLLAVGQTDLQAAGIAIE